MMKHAMCLVGIATVTPGIQPSYFFLRSCRNTKQSSSLLDSRASIQQALPKRLEVDCADRNPLGLLDVSIAQALGNSNIIVVTL
jgi:hypothetical protein